MNRDIAKQIIKKEGLSFYNWFDDHKVRENEVGIYQDDGNGLFIVPVKGLLKNLFTLTPMKMTL